MLAGCGAGTAAIVAGASDDGGSNNSAPSIVNLALPDFKRSPAQIHFELSDREGEAVAVELSARVPLPGGGLSDPQLLTAVGGLGFPHNGAVIQIPPGNLVKVVEVDTLPDGVTPNPNFKPDAPNERVGYDVPVPAGAASAIVKFGMINAGNDWWWAIDHLECSNNGALVLSENFDNVPNTQAPPSERFPTTICRYFSSIPTQANGFEVDTTSLVCAPEALFDFVGWAELNDDAPLRALPAHMLQGDPTKAVPPPDERFGDRR